MHLLHLPNRLMQAKKVFSVGKMGRLRCVPLEAVDVEETVGDLPGTRMSSVTP